MGCSKSRPKRTIYSNTSPPQETRKSSNKQPDFTPKAAREEQSRPKVSRRKEIIKINPKPMGHSKSSSKREVYSNTNLSQETRKISNIQPNYI